MRTAVFLDRDGTIFFDTDYPRDPTAMAFLPGAIDGLRLMAEKGYLLFVVSNQSGVGRGIIKPAEFSAVHCRCVELVQATGIPIEDWSYCTHRPDEKCGCRKPATGLARRSHNGESLDLGASFVLGDKLSDLELGDALGATSYLVLTGKGQETWAALERSRAAGQYKVRADLLAVARELPRR